MNVLYNTLGIFMFVLLLSGCAQSQPDNHNNFNIIIGEKQTTNESPKENLQHLEVEAKPIPNRKDNSRYHRRAF